MRPAIDLYVFVERSIFDSDTSWLDALATLAALDHPGLALQVRTKSEGPERASRLARDARIATQGAKPPLLLNGTTEEALALGYDGVHWPEALIPDSKPSAECRDETSAPSAPPLLKGVSVHSPEAARRAEAAGADFVVAGTVFDAGSKPVAGAGLEALRAMAAATSLPVLAIGGVTTGRVASCIDAGAAGVAVVTSVLRAPDMTAAVRALRVALDEAKVAGRTRG